LVPSGSAGAAVVAAGAAVVAADAAVVAAGATVVAAAPAVVGAAAAAVVAVDDLLEPQAAVANAAVASSAAYLTCFLDMVFVVSPGWNALPSIVASQRHADPTPGSCELTKLSE
jgi:hypothetical protein